MKSMKTKRGRLMLGILLLLSLNQTPVFSGSRKEKSAAPEAAPQQRPVTLVVAAAASLENAYVQELIPLFQKNYPQITVEGVYDSSGRLQTQIEQGLEADIFMSAATPAVGDSVARILETMGLASTGTHGTTAALAILTDMIKKGGVMASTHVGGLSGAFIPVSEDEGMIAAVRAGSLSLDKLEAMTSVCSVGLDMIPLPGDTSPATIAAIIADEMAIGMVNHKTTAVRVIPVPGKQTGEWVHFGGLLGGAPIMAVNPAKSDAFIARGGRIPPPIHSFRN